MQKTPAPQPPIKSGSTQRPHAAHRQTSEQHRTAADDLRTQGFNAHHDSRAAPPAHLYLLHLQRTLGNRAVGQLLQAKVTISHPDDPYEQEADRVADTVRRMAEPAVPGKEAPRLPAKPLTSETIQTKLWNVQRTMLPGIRSIPGRLAGRAIQRLCTACAGEKRQDEGQPEQMVHRQSALAPIPDDEDTKEQQVQQKGAGLSQHIQRFVSSEHRSLGDLNASEAPVDFPEGTFFPGSPPLSYGEIVALSGDFYGSFDHLADPNYINAEGQVVPNSTDRKIREIQQLKRLFQVEAEIRATGHEPEGLDMGYVEHNGETLEGFDKVTAGRYLALAEQNFPHFTVAEGNNISTWMAGHERALTEAYVAGTIGHAQKYLLALARNAASNHYLTDAFASGHMRVPRSDIDGYYRNLMAAVVPGLAQALLARIPEEIGIPIDLRPFVPLPLQPVVDNIPGASRYLRHRISFEIRSRVESALQSHLEGFTLLMRESVGPKLGGLVSKWLHDADNKNGLIVTNKAGQRWVAYGDASLDKAPPPEISVTTTNRAEAQKAVQADPTEVEHMYELDVPANSAPLRLAMVASVPCLMQFTSALTNPNGKMIREL